MAHTVLGGIHGHTADEGSVSITNCSGCSTGRSRSITASTRLKMAALAPIPSASVKTATRVIWGFVKHTDA